MGTYSTDFAPVEHLERLLSLGNVFTADDLRAGPDGWRRRSATQRATCAS
jgi:DNA ligase (NAD+)